MRTFKIIKNVLPFIMTAFTAFCVNAQMNWALPRVSVACVREEPGHAAELGSQVVMGTPLKVLSESKDWVKIKSPEGYEGYIIRNSLKMMSDTQMDRWRDCERVIVVNPDQTYIYSTGTPTHDNRISDVINGSVLELLSADNLHQQSGMLKVRIPDGRTGFIKSSDVINLKKWAERDIDFVKVVDFARMLMGVPYLWGGTSTKSMDCSGLTKIAYFSQGVILPRNASQQAEIGIKVPRTDIDVFAVGDLLMFGNRKTGRVNHVGIYIGNSNFIHCSGRVKINSLNKLAKNYTPLHLLSVRHLDSDAISSMAIRNHPWWFNHNYPQIISVE